MRKTLLSLSALCAALLTPTAPTSGAQTQTGATARVIVKYKADAVLLRKRALSVHDQHARQVQMLGERHGLALRSGIGLHERAQVVLAGGMTSAQLAARLAQDAEVEYAVPDERKRISVAPNDTLYTTVLGAQGPVSGQWYLRPNSGEVKSSIDVEPAWAITTGSGNIVVAVLDTGVRFDHPDLQTVANGGNLLPGFDMVGQDISDFGAPLATFVGANDGDGRDADASDPGDWISAAENSSGVLAGCGQQSSSWHGTQVTGLIGALTDNGAGMAGVGRNVRVLPVRVLGKCGGHDSDIIAGMYWAAGFSVPGVPANPAANWARVINMSLGGSGPCNQLYQDAVNDIAAAGVTIVASAGNSAGHAVSSPANCQGVIGVGGLRHVGTKVGFSDLGPQISLSAPGGNCVNIDPGTACLFPILTTSNAGLRTPVSHASGGSIFTDSFDASLGTSFSAPLVAGSAALMLSEQPLLTPSEVRSMLQSTARAFPTTGGDNGDGTVVKQCVAPNGTDQLQCYCTKSTCGAGMLDAGAAVGLAAVGVVPRITITPASPRAGQMLTLGGTTSIVAAGRSVASYQWAIVSGGGIVTSLTVAADGASASTTPSAAGQWRVSLTVTDSSGAQATSESDIAVAAASSSGAASSGGSSGGGGGGGGVGALWLVALLLAVAALRVVARRRGAT